MRAQIKTTINNIATTGLLLLSVTSFAQDNIKKTPLDGGLSVSMLISVSNTGQPKFSGFTFDPDFRFHTKGFVGRKGKVGNVALVSLEGINVTPSGKGPFTLANNIKNKVDETHIESFDKQTGIEDQIISFGTASPAAFPQVFQFKSEYGTSGLWMNQKGKCANCLMAVSTGMFVDGGPLTAANKDIRTLENSKGSPIPPVFKGALDGMPPGDCEGDGECEWGLKATLVAAPDIHKSITLRTSNSFIHYNAQGKHKTIPRPDLNLTGTLTFDKARNLFTGVIKDARGMTGTAMGQYYGPAHNEIGIVYALGSPTEDSTEMGSIYAVRFGGINK